MIALMFPEAPNLPPQAKTLEEAQELINALWAITVEQAQKIEAMSTRIRELEEKINTTSRIHQNHRRQAKVTARATISLLLW